jgi:hypothetical protein
VYDIEKDRSKEKEMLEKRGKWSVPFMDIEGIYVTGCSEKKIKQAIDQRRAL